MSRKEGLEPKGILLGVLQELNFSLESFDNAVSYPRRQRHRSDRSKEPADGHPRGWGLDEAIVFQACV